MVTVPLWDFDGGEKYRYWVVGSLMVYKKIFKDVLCG